VHGAREQSPVATEAVFGAEPGTACLKIVRRRQEFTVEAATGMVMARVHEEIAAGREATAA
jgi:hypothetical protein